MAKVAKKTRSLKISRKKKPRAGKKVARKRLIIKVSKFNRLLKKARTVAKKSLKAALKGTTVSRITDRTCKKIDTAIAKDPAILAIIEKAVVDVVNTITAVKPPKTKTPKVKKPKEPKPAASEGAGPAEAPTA
jgi:hypothetical protein